MCGLKQVEDIHSPGTLFMQAVGKVKACAVLSKHNEF